MGAVLKSGMPCNQCAHPTCKFSFVKQGVLACLECLHGAVVLDVVSAPKWRLDCNSCPYLVYLPPDLHSAKVLADDCEVRCGRTALDSLRAFEHERHLCMNSLTPTRTQYALTVSVSMYLLMQ